MGHHTGGGPGGLEGAVGALLGGCGLNPGTGGGGARVTGAPGGGGARAGASSLAELVLERVSKDGRGISTDSRRLESID